MCFVAATRDTSFLLRVKKSFSFPTTRDFHNLDLLSHLPSVMVDCLLWHFTVQ